MIDAIDTKPDQAPGCFGSALAFKAESAECTPCPFNQQCEPVSAHRLETLRAELGLTDFVKTPRRRASTTSETPGLTPSLPKKVQTLIDRINASGLNVGGSLRDGRNPFSKPAFLKVAAHLLMRMEGGFDRNALRTAFQHKLGWGEATATAHVGQCFHLFPALGVAEEVNGRLVLRKED